jgi:hypothetical protein
MNLRSYVFAASRRYAVSGSSRQCQASLCTACVFPLLIVMALGRALAACAEAALANSFKALTPKGRFGVAVTTTVALGCVSACLVTLVPEEIR